MSASARDVSIWSSSWDDAWSNQGAWQDQQQPYSNPNAQIAFSNWLSSISTQDMGEFMLNGMSIESFDPAVHFQLQGGELQWVQSEVGELPTIQLGGEGTTTLSTAMRYFNNTMLVNSGRHILTLDGHQYLARGTTQTFVNGTEGRFKFNDTRLMDDVATDRGGSGVILKFINQNTEAGSFQVGNFNTLENSVMYIGGPGTVDFAGNTRGDLFTGSLLLHILEGGTFSFNGNAESMGALAGDGTLNITSAGVATSMAGHFRFGGKITGNGYLLLEGVNHSFHLHSESSDYTETTQIRAGKMFLYHDAVKNEAGALGKSNLEVMLGHISGSSLAQLLLGAEGIELGRDIRVQTGNTGAVTLGAVYGSGSSLISGNITLGSDNRAGKSLNITSASGGELRITGDINRATGATGDWDALSFVGDGTVHLSGNHSYHGATSVTGGKVILDYGQNQGSKLSDTANLVMNGGSLELIGHASEAVVESVSGLQLGLATNSIGGGGQLKLRSQGADLTLSVGAIQRSKGSSLDIAHDRAAGDSFLVTTSTNDASGILGSYATYEGRDWATVGENGVVEGLSTANYLLGAFGEGQHSELQASTSAGTGAVSQSLKMTGSAAVTFESSTSELALTTGGILVASGTKASHIGTTAVRGRLSAANGELLIHQHSTAGALAIHSVISGNQSLVKSGSGTLILSGSNTYSGNTYLNGGTLEVTSANALGAHNSGTTNTVYINGGTLSVRAANGLTGGSTESFRKIHIGEGGATLAIHSNSNVQKGNLIGSGTLTKTGVGNLIFGTSPSDFTGDLHILDGKILLNSQQLNRVANVYVRENGSYHINDDAIATFTLASGGRFVLNGMGFRNQGALIVDDQSSTSNVVDPVITINRQVELVGTSKITVSKGSAPGSRAQLILTESVDGQGGLIKAGTGTLVLRSHRNDYKGRTEIQNGVIRLDAGSDRLPTATELILGHATTSGQLKLNGYAQTVQGLTTQGTGKANAVVGGDQTAVSQLTVNVASGENVFNGVLGGVGSDSEVGDYHANNLMNVDKTGQGTLVLGGRNTYSGATTVSEGVLKLEHERALGGAGVGHYLGEGLTQVKDGATLDLNGQNNVQEIIEIAGAGHGDMGALVNHNTAQKASIGNGIASLSVHGLEAGFWTPETSLTIENPSNGAAPSLSASLGLHGDMFTVAEGGSGFSNGNSSVRAVGGGEGTGAVLNLLFGVTDQSFTVTSGTTQYDVAPQVTLRYGATGEAMLDDQGFVVGIRVIDPGTGYHTGRPSASFSGGTVRQAGTAPTAEGVNNQYRVVGINVADPGQGYTSAPTIEITRTGGTQAQVVVDTSKMVLNGFVVNDAGSGYHDSKVVSVQREGGGATPYVVGNASAIRLVQAASIGGAGDLDIHATVTGEHDLTKVGAGTVTLSGPNQYHGLTLVKQGALLVANREGSGTGTGSVRVEAGATLGGAGSITGFEAQSITLDKNAHLLVGMKHGADAIAQKLVLGQQGLGVEILLQGNLNFDLMQGSLAEFLPRTETLGLTHDVLELQSTAGVNLSDSTLWIAAADTSTWQDGDRWRVIDWSNLQLQGLLTEGMSLGTHQVGNYELTGLIETDGYYVVAHLVPEPRRWMLVTLALMGLILRRRRKA